MKRPYGHTRLFVIFCCCLFAFRGARAQGWEWAKAGVGQIDEYGQSVATDGAGNVYVCGVFNSAIFTYGTATFVNPGCSFSGASCEVLFLLKCDPGGNVIWRRTAFGNGSAVSLSADNTGNIYMAGYFYSATIIFDGITLNNNVTEHDDVFLVKYDSSGNVQWARSAGGNSDDVPVAVSADAAGNAVMTGHFNSASITFGGTTLTNDSTGTNIFTVKYDAGGNVAWAAGAAGKLDDEAAYVTTDAQNNSYVTGYFRSPVIVFGHDTLVNDSSNQNMFVVKYDAGGNVTWAKDPGKNDNISPASITADAFGNVYVTGYYWGYTAAFDTFTLTNPDTANSGYTYGYFLVRYDTAGNTKWVRTAIGNDYTEGMCITSDAAGFVYVAGNTESDNLAFGTDTLPNNDIFLAKYDSLGNVYWLGNAHGIFGDYPYCITPDGLGSLYMSGSFSSWVMDFGSTSLRDTNNLYMFLAKYNTANVLVPAVKQNSGISIYPNPATTSLTISAADVVRSISVTNLLGQAVYSRECNAQIVQADISALPAGVYFVRVNGTEVRKFVKE